MDLRKLFAHYLVQLEVILCKTPPELFSSTLTEGTFSLEKHAKVAANFSLRGYCSLINVDPPPYYQNEKGKASVLEQLEKTQDYLRKVDSLSSLNDDNYLTDRAGFREVRLCESEFIHMYILPNFMFHISMVYSIAKLNGVELGKGDFDGFHSYPRGFSFDK
ncbi:TPA: DUF1993 family protein [Vibrio diabolicus]